jgi:hypothetical protein
MSPAPSPPTGLAAVAGNGQVSLSWAAVSGATSYGVYSGPGMTGMPKIGTASTNIYVVTGLTNGQTYYFGVSSIN